MSNENPIPKTKDQLSSIINTIESQQSAVGIDAQYTHAIVIDYLASISQRIDALEQTIKNQNK